MAEWHDLTPEQQQIANAVMDKIEKNEPPEGKYPPTREGVRRYLNDYGGQLAVGSALGAGGVYAKKFHELVAEKHGPKLLAYLENFLMKVLR